MDRGNEERPSRVHKLRFIGPSACFEVESRVLSSEKRGNA